MISHMKQIDEILNPKQKSCFVYIVSIHVRSLPNSTREQLYLSCAFNQPKF